MNRLPRSNSPPRTPPRTLQPAHDAPPPPRHHRSPLPPARPRSAPGHANDVSTLTNLKRESLRLDSFRNWPYTVVTGASLAEAGFFRIFREDRVQCAFCLGILGQWEAGDDARSEHRRCFPTCPFIRGLPCGNVPIEEEGSLPRVEFPSETVLSGGFRNPSYPPETMADDLPVDITSPHLTVRPGCDVSELGINPYCNPLEPKYATFESRVSTFRGWDVDRHPTAQALAEAGWYFTGVSGADATQCFHCGGSLVAWETDDDPWIEHAKWFPHCRHVRMVRGKEFVQDVISNINMKNVPTRKPEPAESSEDVPEDLLCKVCISSKVSLVFLPCSHLCACATCASSLDKCPICREPFKGYIKVFY